MLENTEAALWDIFQNDINDICAETVLRYRRPTFRAVEHLLIIMLKAPMPIRLNHVNQRAMYSIGMKLAQQILDEHDWTAGEFGPVQQHRFLIHLDRIKNRLPSKIIHFHALLMDEVLMEKLEREGSFLAFMQSAVHFVVENTIACFVNFHLLTKGYPNGCLDERQIARLLILACLSKTDSPIQTHQKMHDRLDIILAHHEFRMPDPMSTLHAEWTATTLVALETEPSKYFNFLRSVVDRRPACQCDSVPTLDDEARAFPQCPWHAENFEPCRPRSFDWYNMTALPIPERAQIWQ